MKIQKSCISIIIAIQIFIIIIPSLQHQKQISFQIKNPYHYVPIIDNNYNIASQIYKQVSNRFEKRVKPDYFIEIVTSSQHTPNVIFNHQYNGSVQITNINNNNNLIKQKTKQVSYNSKQVVQKRNNTEKILSKNSTLYYVLFIDGILIIILICLLICYLKTNYLDCCNRFCQKLFGQRNRQLKSQQNGTSEQNLNQTSLSVSKINQKNQSSSSDQQQDNKISEIQ